jgi:hypothetical protein
MKGAVRIVVLLVSHALVISPVMETIAQEGAAGPPEGAEVVVISEKVGEVIDREERDHYDLFRAMQGFQCAVVLLLPDGSYALEVNEAMDDTTRVRRVRIQPWYPSRLGEYIDRFEELTPEARRAFFTHPEILRRNMARHALAEAREQARDLAKEKWTNERWREEARHDRAGTYRGGAATLGFILGATAGMLIGKGFQGKKVERTVYHEGGWLGGDPWTEEFYSYRTKHAPHWGAVIGGAAGAVTGYVLGRKADKVYYALIPKDIRTSSTGALNVGRVAASLLLVGPLTGTLAGLTLATPSSGRRGDTAFDGTAFVTCWLSGAIFSMIALSNYSGRARHMRLWRESFFEQEAGASLDIELFPTDPTALSVHAVLLPSGKTVYEYRMDMVRICF